ncbi:hypothetical protein KBG_88 [Mycobacterium phage KBG]|uniref:Uncharacterized protein n=2 Tax=Caudoviricetes TaxID=2731619 RepID=B3VG59_9CAUD|nr:hypothetical protein KBG_88 [Mycobacterium phage KBG]ACE79836.1 hypothetical protein KBG_88 [Mycobacterium phage KBG]
MLYSGRIRHTERNSKMSTITTSDLIAEYEDRIAGRWVKCQLGSTRAVSRQRKINDLVDEISRRADDGDPVALAWYEA